MLKRVFYALLGVGAGVTLGIYAVRRLEALQRRLSAEGLARSAQGRAGSVAARLGEALEAGREAAATREAELRADAARRAVDAGEGGARPAPPHDPSEAR